MLMQLEKGITLQQQEAAIHLASFRNKPAELVQAEKDLLTAKSGGKFMGGGCRIWLSQCH